MYEALLQDGVHGLFLMGTVGEGNPLTGEEKCKVRRAAVKVSGGQVPVIAGVSEFTTLPRQRLPHDAERLRACGLMMLPAMVCVPTPAQLEHQFPRGRRSERTAHHVVRQSTELPVHYRFVHLARLAQVLTIVAIKESAPDSRRFTDRINAFGDRFVLRGRRMGKAGNPALCAEALCTGDLDSARKNYRWFMPIFHWDGEHDLVQSIKLAEAVLRRGSERVRLPRRVLSGERRAAVLAMIERARDMRPR